jgi:hypothetical protein
MTADGRVQKNFTIPRELDRRLILHVRDLSDAEDAEGLPKNSQTTQTAVIEAAIEAYLSGRG